MKLRGAGLRFHGSCLVASGLVLASAACAQPYRLPEAELQREAALIDALTEPIGHAQSAGLASRLASLKRDLDENPYSDILRKKWNDLNRPLEWPPPASDAAFLRRAWLDLCGSIPPADEVAAFLADQRVAKRVALIDRLLSSPEYAQTLAGDLVNWLKVEVGEDDVAAAGFRRWLEASIARNAPWNALMREMLTEEGASLQHAAAGWMSGGADCRIRKAVAASAVFLGRSLHCAQCHDDPFGDATQMQVFGLAAVFAQPGEARLPMHYKYRDGVPGQILQKAWVPGKEWSVGLGARAGLAEWLTGGARSQFASAIAWGVWKRLFGQVSETQRGRDWEPASGEVRDDETALIKQSQKYVFTGSECTPAPAEPTVVEELAADPDGAALLQGLAALLIRLDYDLREFHRVLCNTRAYQREARASEAQIQLGDAPVRSPLLRRLSRSQIWNSLRIVARGKVSGSVGPGLLGDDTLRSPSLPLSPGLTRWMMNGEAVREAARGLSASQGGKDNVDEIFMAILSRKPGAEEAAAARRMMHSGGDEEGVAWALLNTAEFLFSR